MSLDEALQRLNGANPDESVRQQKLAEWLHVYSPPDELSDAKATGRRPRSAAQLIERKLAVTADFLPAFGGAYVTGVNPDDILAACSVAERNAVVEALEKGSAGGNRMAADGTVKKVWVTVRDLRHLLDRVKPAEAARNADAA